jgi:metal-sulfur cluster biosynthetic enzyme
MVEPGHEAILAALAHVIDPELQQPVTELDMVRERLDRRGDRLADDRVDDRRLPVA